MYEICHKCQKLIPENSKVCPECGHINKNIVKRRWYCNTCEMYIDPKKGVGAGVEGFDATMGALSAITGNLNDAIQYSEIGEIKRRLSDNPDNLQCPKCGGTNLTLAGTHTSREETSYNLGLSHSIKLVAFTQSQLRSIITRIEEGQTHKLEELPESHQRNIGLSIDYKEGYLTGLKSLLIEDKPSEERNLNSFSKKMKL